MKRRSPIIGRGLRAACLIAAASALTWAQPTLSSFGFTPGSIDTSNGSANVTVSFTLADSSATVTYFEMSFQDPTGVFIQRGIKSNPMLTDSVTVAFPRFSNSGTWTVLGVFAADGSGNTMLLSTADLAARSLPTTLSVTTSQQDITPPALKSFAFTPTSFDTGTSSQTVTVNFETTDDLSGVASVYAGFISPSGQVIRGTRVNAPGDFVQSKDVTSSFTIPFPKLGESGTWTISFVNVTDSSGNTIFLDASAVAGLGFPTTLTVSSTLDTTAPTLTSSSILPGTISTAGATVTVNFTVADDLSGATDFEIAFTSPSMAQVQSDAVSFAASTSFSGTASVTFPPNTEQGSWTATIFLADASGNTRTITQANALTVTPPGSDTTPPVIIPTVSPLPNGAGWNNSLPVTVTWTVTDPESGISSKSGCDPTTFNSPTTGTSLTCVATNGATPPLSNSASVTVMIDIAPPVTTNVIANPNPVIINNDVTISATVTDSGGSNVSSAEFQVDGGPFDDLGGTFGTSSVNVSLTLPASATPLLQTTGVHSICVRGHDFADNIGATQCVLFAVYDPSGGFTTGGGGTNSPAGADVANPTGTGPVTFAFNPKYLPNNSNVPAGDLEFHYAAGGIDFKSTSWDFLVITNGNRGQAQGTGTINNGASTCKFSLDAWDNSFQPSNVDAFGLTIFNCDGGTTTRYSLTTAPITKGSIVVHQ